MNIIVNGETKNISENKSIQDLVSDLKLHKDKIVIEHNAKILKSDEWNETTLKNNDKLEIISFVGGG